MSSVFFFFNDTATTEIYTLSLHDALPICSQPWRRASTGWRKRGTDAPAATLATADRARPRAHRSEEHTSELQSRQYLVCRLLLEKKKKLHKSTIHYSSNVLILELFILNIT